MSFKTPELNLFCNSGKRALNYTCVKVVHSLKCVSDSKWQRLVGYDVSPKGSWRTLYKLPIDKRTSDQWRIIHRARTTNRHVDPTVREELILAV